MSRAPSSTDAAPPWLRWVTRGSLVLGAIALAVTVWKVGVGTLVTHLQTIGPWFAMLFALIGAPSSVGVALAFARRVNQIIFAALGFSVLAADRIAKHVDVPSGGDLAPLTTLATSLRTTGQHVVLT